MKLTTTSSTGHFAMFQTVTAVLAEPDQIADLLGQTAGQHDRDRRDREQGQQHDREADAHRAASSRPGDPPPCRRSRSRRA